MAWQKFGLCTPVWDLILPGIRLCQWNVSTFYMIIIMQFLLRLRAEPRIAAEVYMPIILTHKAIIFIN